MSEFPGSVNVPSSQPATGEVPVQGGFNPVPEVLVSPTDNNIPISSEVVNGSTGFQPQGPGTEFNQTPVQQTTTTETQASDTKEPTGMERAYAEHMRETVKDVLRDSLGVTPENHENAVDRLSSQLAFTKSQTYHSREGVLTGYDSEVWEKTVLETCANNVGQEFLNSVQMGSPDRFLAKLNTIKGVCDKGQALDSTSYTKVLKSFADQLTSSFVDRVTLEKTRPGAYSILQEANTKNYKGLDGFIFLSEQTFGPEYSNQLKSKYQELTGKLYQPTSRPEDMDVLRLGSLPQRLLRPSNLPS